MAIPTKRSAAAILDDHASDFVKWRLKTGSFVASDLSYLYVDTAKCACTATKMHLWELEKIPRRAPWPVTVHDRPAGDPRRSLLDLTREEANYVLTNPGVVRFYVYRAPEHRIASAFMNKIHDLNLQDYENARYAIRMKFGLASSKDITVDHFAEFVCDIEDAQRDVHWKSQAVLIMTDLIDYNAMVSVGTYATDMERLFEKLGASPDSDFAEIINRTGSERLTISDLLLKRVRAEFAPDYTLAEIQTD